MLALCQSNHIALAFYEHTDKSYGMDEGRMGERDDEGILIPCSTIGLSEELNSQLHQHINLIADDRNFGIDLYQQFLESNT